MNQKFKKSISYMLLIIIGFCAYCQNFIEGEQLFKTNQPSEAIPVLLKALSETNVNPLTYNYLGLSYYQIGKYEKALDIFTKGIKVPGTNKRLLYFNAGNAAFSLGQYDKAEEMYSFAITADPSFSSAILNRANTRMQKFSYDLAAEDYNQYLVVEPNSDQEPQIRRLLALLAEDAEARRLEAERLALEQERIAAEEKRIAEEQARLEQERLAQEAVLKAEQERLAAEAAVAEAERQAAEAERRRKLLEEVAATLQEGASTHVSAGTEGVIEYDYDEELD